MNNQLTFHLKLHNLRTKLLNDPYYRLKSGEEIHLAAQLGLQIDVNQADIDDWLRLPGISIHQARSLVMLSRSGVRFYCVEDIAAALSISVHRLELWSPLLNFSYYEPAYLVNPNTATIESLVKIPLIHPSLATAIVQNRLAAGNFANLVDFQQRLAISGEAIAQLMYYLQF
jgi:DNA uptake protein ComE-like DNA-binding protein